MSLDQLGMYNFLSSIISKIPQKEKNPLFYRGSDLFGFFIELVFFFDFEDSDSACGETVSFPICDKNRGWYGFLGRFCFSDSVDTGSLFDDEVHAFLLSTSIERYWCLNLISSEKRSNFSQTPENNSGNCKKGPKNLFPPFEFHRLGAINIRDMRVDWYS